MTSLVLASASPRRAALLRMAGYRFEIVPSGVEETVPERLSPEHLVLRVAGRKAEAVAAGRREGLVLGADTVVDLDGDILEKPADREHAVDMLWRLSGRTHRVHTGLFLLDASSGRQDGRAVRTEVTFRALSGSEIARYVDTPEPYDKAGAYAAQGRAAPFIARVEGCFYNVVGLPLSALWELLFSFTGGRPWPFLDPPADGPDLLGPVGPSQG